MELTIVKDQVGSAQRHQGLEVDLTELYNELSARGDNNGLFMEEIAELIGKNRKTTNAFVRAAMDAGRCKLTRKQKAYVDGRVVMTAAYIFTPGK